MWIQQNSQNSGSSYRGEDSICYFQDQAAYGEKFDPLILFDSKRDVSGIIGGKTEARSIQEHLKKKQ